ncbi:MAG: hypothetical protein KC635_21655 [Myxococcales bacterium]|nr:hypothetical protein [Myxococcales bacterium]
MKAQLLRHLVVGLACGLAAVLLSLGLRAGAAGSGIPTSVAYSGYLDIDGAPVEGVLDLRVGLYASDVGGDAAYTWELPAVPFDAGRFTVALPLDDGAGGLNAAGLLLESGASVFVGVEVPYRGVWTALSERQPLEAAPYAVSARYSVDFDVDGDLRVVGRFLPDEPLAAGNLAAGSVGTAELADGAVTAEKLAAAAVTQGAFATGAIKRAKLASDSVGLDALIGTPVPVYHANAFCYGDKSAVTLDDSPCSTRLKDTCTLTIDGQTSTHNRYYTCVGGVQPCQLFNSAEVCPAIVAGYLVPGAASP